jgi:UDP-N-acetylmuramate dehydrogenase
MEIQTNFLKLQYFWHRSQSKTIVANSTAELTSVLEQNKSANKFILGGGSNMLLTKDIDALVIHIDLKGKRITAENEDYVWVESQKIGTNSCFDHRSKFWWAGKHVPYSW